MSKSSDFLKSLKEDLTVSRAEMLKIIKDFHREMYDGLAGRPGSLKMLPAYVDRPSGDEKGDYIALDLGGTNFRVLKLGLNGSGRVADPTVMKFSIPRDSMTGEGKILFSFLAACVKKFLKKEKIDIRRHFDLGFTFSFPVRQRGVASGELVVWTKGFAARGVIGKDVVLLLREALEREGLYGIRVTALANDTVGTLVARAYSDKTCDMGVIIGTGTNACYIEKISSIKKLKGSKAGAKGSMIVNIEWGNFNKLRRGRCDISLDKATDNPGQQILEKMVSGMYLGELTRLALIGLAERGFISCGVVFCNVLKPMSLKSEYVSVIESDRSRGLLKINLLLKNLGIAGSSHMDRKIIKDVCSAVSGRAARISAAAMAAVIKKIDPAVSDKHTIAIDGSVYEKHPGFSGNIECALKEIFGRKASRIKLVLSKDGSGRGSAIIAAVAASKDRPSAQP